MNLVVASQVNNFTSILLEIKNYDNCYRSIAAGLKETYRMRELQTTFLFLLILFTAQAQELNVRGIVISTEDGGQPIADVEVLVKGTDVRVYTKNSGEYDLLIELSSYADIFYHRNNPQSPVLLFSKKGYRTMEIPVKARTVIDLVMQPESNFESVIETGSALGRPQELLCYSVGEVKEEAITTTHTTDIGIGLQGKVPGLRVNQVNGQPGQGVFFQLRSANSIANGQQPLVLLDGIYLNGSSLADINLENVERVEVLKGAAGASLFGSRAANGVIQIFTKRGESLPEIGTKVLYRGEFGYTEEVNRYAINEFTNRVVENPAGPQPVLGAASSQNIHLTPLPNLQDYQSDFLFQRGLFNTHNITVLNKSAKTNFLASFQRLEDEGIIQTSEGFTRNSFQLNLDHRISNKFDIYINGMYADSEQDLISAYSNGPQSFLATTLFFTPMFDLGAANEEDGTNFDWDIDNTGDNITNPLYDRNNSSQLVNRTRMLGGIGANYSVSDWFTLSYFAALDRSENNYQYFLKKGYLSTNIPSQFGRLATFDPSLSNGGGIQLTNRVNTLFISRADAKVKKAFGNFNTAFRLSFLYEDQTDQFREAIGENLTVSRVQSMDNAQSNIRAASEQQDFVAYSGFFIGDIDYRNKYIFSGLFRREGTSLFGPNEQWSNYYRVSAAYRVSQDLKIKGIQELKLRASMGTAGIRPTFEQRFETFQLENGSLSKNTLGNNTLRPSTATEQEIGLDMTFLRHFNLEANYVLTETVDQILLVRQTAAAGFLGQWQNAGTLESTVYDAKLSIDLAQIFKMRNKGFNWSVTGVFDRIEQTVKQLDIPSYTTGPGLQQSDVFLIEEGKPLGTMVGEVFATSLDQLQNQEGINASDYALNSAGYVVRKDLLGTPNEIPYKLVDANGNAIVEEIGNVTPDYRLSFIHNFEFKRFKLYTLVDWKKGGEVYNLTKQWLFSNQRHAEVSQYPDVAASFYGSEGLYNNLVPNSHFAEDASYIMIREAALSYTFKSNQLSGIFGNLIESMELALIGRNLFTQTDYTGFHPDVTSAPRDENSLSNRVSGAPGSNIRTPNGDPNIFAVDAFNYPLRKSYTFSLQVTF